MSGKSILMQDSDAGQLRLAGMVPCRGMAAQIAMSNDANKTQTRTAGVGAAAVVIAAIIA